MGAYEELAEVSKTLENEYVGVWKSQGKKVMGYACTYLPEELLYAMDILPYRLTGRGATDTSTADSYLSRVNCSFARCCLELGFGGEYDFLDGAVFVNGCDHIRRAYENWAVHESAALPFMYILPVPHKITPEGLEWFGEEVGSLKGTLERRFKVKASPEKLSQAVAVYNESRKLLRRLYDLRAGEDPPVTGAQMLTIISASTAMPKAEFNVLLKQVLDELESKPKNETGKTRLLIAGSIMDDPEFIENVESLGAVVVADTLCFGARGVWNLTEEGGDPLAALVKRYYEHEPCPRMAGHYRRRLAFVREQVERAGVDGVILEHIKFCDQHGTDNALLKKDLEESGLPVIELEREYGPLSDAGRVRTRVQAFLERIG